MDPWSYAVRAYSASVSIQERLDVATAGIDIICYIATRGRKIVLNQLVEVPDLLSSFASLCDVDVLS